jgi:hypothetical protein
MGILNAIKAHPVATLGIAAAGTAGVRGAMDAGKQKDQVRNQIEAMKHDVSTPVRKFAEDIDSQIKTASLRYDAFVEKMADGFGDYSKPHANSFASAALSGFGGKVVSTLADKLFQRPINKVFDIIDKKFYMEPQQKNVFQQVTQSDPILAKAMHDTPEIVMDAYNSIKRFAPTLTVDTNALRNFLRQAVALGGQLDPMSIKLLAETEKAVRQSRGQLDNRMQ